MSTNECQVRAKVIFAEGGKSAGERLRDLIVDLSREFTKLSVIRWEISTATARRLCHWRKNGLQAGGPG